MIMFNIIKHFIYDTCGIYLEEVAGYTADLAADGQGALNAVEKAQYDLILMDIQMQDTLKTVNSNTQLAKALDARP